MALLQSFPPSNTISPSVRFTEQDLTLLQANTIVEGVGLVGFCSKGPINTPTLVSTVGQLQQLFGYPNLAEDYPPYLYYAAANALTQSSAIFIVRVADTDPLSPYYAETAQVQVPSAGGLLKIYGAVYDIDDTIQYTQNKFFRWSLNGILASKTLVLLGDGTSTTAYTVPKIVAELNAQLDPAVDGVEFFVQEGAGNNVSVGFQSVWAYGSQSRFELYSVLNNLVGGEVAVTGSVPSVVDVNNAIGLGIDMTPAAKVGTTTHFPVDASHTTAGIWTFAAGTYTLQVVVTGSGNVAVDNVIRQYDLTDAVSGQTFSSTADLCTALNTEISTATPTVNGIAVTGTPVCFEFVDGATLADPMPDHVVLVTTTTATDNKGGLYGRFAQLNVRGGTLAPLLGLTTITGGMTPAAVGVSPLGVADDGVGTSGPGRFIGDDTLDPTDTGYYTFQVLADSPGTEGNQTFITTRNYPGGDTFSIDVFIINSVSGATLNVESWGNLTKNPASFYYVQTYINNNSNYIRIIDNTATSAPPNTSIPETTIAANRLRLSGGSDGYPADNPAYRDDLLIGSPINLSGVYAFSDPEQTNINICAVPGGTSTDVILALINMCEVYRQDCLAIIDPPSGMNPTQVIQWQNGVSEYNRVRFDSDFAALYWPWIFINDTYNNAQPLVPPSIGVMAALLRSDSVSAPWFAPAGLLRGIVPNCVGVASKPTLAEKDAMYGNGNAINPIVTYTGVAGFVIWGNKTLQRLPTALDRVNVRRMLFYVEKQIRAASRSLLFQPNNANTRQRFVGLATAILSNVQNSEGITAFSVICNDALNPPDVVDRNEMRAQIGIIPTRALEFIFIEFTLYRTGTTLAIA
jgi:phage tail sheath protein FI